MSNVSSLILLLVCTVFTLKVTAQTHNGPKVVLENKTSTCTYLVKINITDSGSCRPNGIGPLVVLKPNSKTTLPAVPKQHWVMGYGIEEVGENAARPELFFVAACRNRTPPGLRSGCHARVMANGHHLEITPREE